MKRLAGPRIILRSLLMAILAFSLLPVFVAGQEVFENEDGKVEWTTSTSKEQVIRGEQFYATLNLSCTIKKMPNGTGYGVIVNLVNKMSSSISIGYDVIARKGGSAEEVALGSYGISKSLPELKEGAKLDFLNEKIPSEGYLSFPDGVEYGHYTLYVRYTDIEAKVSVLPHMNITEKVRKYLPLQAFDPGIKLGEIELIESLSSDSIPPRVISLLPNDHTAACDSIISVTFNKPVEEGSAKAAFSISPKVPGELEYRDNVLTFTPNRNLSRDTQYTVTIAMTVKDMVSTSMTDEFQQTFITAPGPSRWWFWPTIGGSLVVSGVLICFLIIRRRRARL